MSTMRVFVPRDATACALGADAVAATIGTVADQQGIDLQLIRNGSRGAFWLEPLVEVETPAGRVGFGPVQAEQVADLFAAGFPGDQEHPLALGPVSGIAWFARQQRLTFARVGWIDPLSLDDYRAHGGFRGLERALAMTSQDIVEEVRASGLRGRGGAAFPTGTKWQTVLDAPGSRKFVVCNADEGDAGTFADRLLMEADPFQLIEGLVIAALAVGAEEGFIYLRSEYPHCRSVLTEALARAEQAGYLGERIRGSDRDFRIELRIGAGAYICGEETSLLESLEGKRGLVRFKPPVPAVQGLLGLPTVVNNVLSLAAVTTILADGAQAYHNVGSGRSRGTLTAQLAGNVRRGGLVEVPFGLTLRELVTDYGGGTASGRPVRALQVGGPLGAYLPEALWDTPLDYEALSDIGGMLGHGGIVVFDDRVNLAQQARFAMEFCAFESCGKCTPCRVGSVRGVEAFDRLIAGSDRRRERQLIEDLCSTMEDGSLCAMGGLTPVPVHSAMKHFPEDFR